MRRTQPSYRSPNKLLNFKSYDDKVFSPVQNNYFNKHQIKFYRIKVLRCYY